MVSRIHVYDLCRVILALAAAVRSGNEIALVNAVDDRPSLNSETYKFIEESLGIAVPGKWRTAPLEGRKITSLYARKLLEDGLTYPTYHEGFLQCLSESKWHESLCKTSGFRRKPE